MLIYIGSPSVLLVPRANQKQQLESFSWEQVFIELKEKVPLLLDVLAAVAIPSDKDVTGKEVPAICTAYCILMNQRWKELSLLQKINSVALGFGHATEKVHYVSLDNLLL